MGRTAALAALAACLVLLVSTLQLAVAQGGAGERAEGSAGGHAKSCSQRACPLHTSALLRPSGGIGWQPGSPGGPVLGGSTASGGSGGQVRRQSWMVFQPACSCRCLRHAASCPVLQHVPARSWGSCSACDGAPWLARCPRGSRPRAAALAFPRPAPLHPPPLPSPSRLRSSFRR